eukprot:2335306-Rhodomonas_salina.2
MASLSTGTRVPGYAGYAQRAWCTVPSNASRSDTQPDPAPPVNTVPSTLSGIDHHHGDPSRGSGW